MTKLLKFKLKYLLLSIILINNCYVNAEDGDIIASDVESIDPVDSVEPNNLEEHERDERHVFGLFKKKPVQGLPVAAPLIEPGSGYGQGGYHGAGFVGGYGNANFNIKTVPSQAMEMLGFKTASHLTKTTNNFLLNARQQLPPLASCGPYQLPSNVMYRCQGNQCEVTCPNMYQFPDGSRSLKLACIGGSWIVRDSAYTQVPPCQANCQPPCQNNGICIEAGQCKCPENFSGPYCQYKKAICAAQPPVPKYSKVTCTNNICNAECMRGFQYPDGSQITNLECKDGQWLHVKTGLPRPPDCGPICSPPCSNGGQCISFNVCQCPKDFRGPTCERSIQVCNITRTDFIGNYKCGFDADEARCTLSCPFVEGLKVVGDLSIEYKCNYASGEFYPQPLPKCIYPPGYTIRSGKQTAHFSKQTGAAIGGHGGAYGVEYLTQHERILAILAKYRDFEHKSEWWSSEEVVTVPNSYSLYMTGEANLMVDKTPKPALCVTWGGNNIKTFDSLVFKAPLSCSHTLVTDKLDATFDVVLKACPYGSGYGCAHSLRIYWQSILYTFENINGTVRLSTPTKQLPLPVQVMGMKVVPIAQHVQIDLESVGLKIDWDRAQSIYVHAGPALWGKVGGLCGSLDGDNKNDLMSKRGIVLETVKSFADSWRVEDKSDLCVMENSAEVDFGSETCDPEKRKKAFAICERLLTNEKLSKCMETCNFEALLRNCVDDYCNCANRDKPETCNCDAVAMLAKECTFKGVKLEHGWRNLEICPISCSYGRVYLPCGPDSEPTCESPLPAKTGKCNEGCFCPEGTVQYKEACITPELCPCTMRGKEFKPESVVKKECNSCTCKNGQWKCTDEKCGARCGSIGDPHYQTFDGKRYDFMGKCSYYLLKTANLSVEAENVACSGVISENMQFAATMEDPSCTKSVTIRFTLQKGVQTVVKMGQGMTTYVNNKEITKFPKILGAGEVLLRHPSSTFMTLEFPGGIRVWWDGVTRVYIDVPPSFRQQTAGLCGTFNSNTQDDFLTPEGDIETAVEPFADKWRTKDTCDFLSDTGNTPHPCSVNPEKRAIAEKHCAWITEDIFQDCHWTVEPEQYYEDCLYDVCACKDDPAKCFCPILAAYGTECMRQGIKTGWRLAVKECAIKCPLGQVYNECGDSCTRSCDDLPTKNTCKKECVEGCHCPHGEYLNEHNECVPQAKCHCSYDGVNFKPGYKEVRPGAKFLDLCTCTNGLWECEDAQTGDEQKYPPSSELRAECANRPFAEFTKCAAKEPKTCKNMHEYVEDTEDCVPGCVCMAGYVYDTSKKSCVLPENCSCHHAGKSYNDGEQMKEDCNVCVCQAGNWKCSKHGCEATCSVWGDSHFTTFDNHEFDFQGACDYVLAKGKFENGDGFSITIQNVLCGTMGVTCSKSVEISLTGSVQDTLTLTSDSMYMDDPNKSTISKLRDIVNAKAHGAFHVYRAGVFIVVEVIPLKLQLKWDEGTRVYVKLGNEWKKSVSGLCGNYNDNAMDDMQTPSNGMETSSLLFGHAWKVQQYCAVPTQPIDACKEHPEREAWAQLKCGVLKSETFQACHSEVPVERYLKRCIFDSCACDQGGDCECLCTAIAAYSHACSQKGVNIRWRTPHFCPMQCDPQCSEYKACTPACAVETCDNFLDQGIAERMCNKENCLEGCNIKPCAEGMIYLNDSYRDCVLKSECKPVCMVKDEKTYYEGDVTYQDDCATCRCSKKKEVCSGVKCSAEVVTEKPAKLIEGTTLAPPPVNTQEEKKCVRGWTRWLDNDSDASAKIIRLNDEEKLPRYDKLESIYGTCTREFMKKIECRVVDSHESSDFMDENVFCNLEQGLACVGKCHDYEIRVFCQCDEVPETTPAPTEKPQTGLSCDVDIAEYKEYPGDCHKFLHCQPKNVAGEWTYVEKTCGDSMMFNPTMYICDHIAAVREIKPSCGEKKDVPVIPECANGMVMSECANQCENTCHYYGSVLKKRGLCKAGEHCKPGCVSKERPDCPAQGKYWRDENTCVEADECPCMDKTEKYVQPHMPVEAEWEVCQCIDNAYTCVPNKLEQKTLKPLLETTTLPPAAAENTTFIIPTVTTPPLRCKPELLKRLIQGDSPLPDSVFSASSELGLPYKPALARLYANAKESSGSWAPAINDQMQYLQIAFEEPEPIFGIIMAGSTGFDNYVTLFKLLYTHDGEAYHYLVDETDKPQLFNGPLDSRAPVQTLFKIPVEAKSVRVYPLKWHGSIAMRVELLGCGDAPKATTEPLMPPVQDTTEASIDTTTSSYEDELQCVDPMGVENDKMHPQQVKASSIWQLPKPAKKPRLIDLLKLSSPIGWKPLVNTPNEYVEFDFLEPRNVSGFKTKGGPEGWVKGYKILFSKNRMIWNTILTADGQPEIFTGNHDGNSDHINRLRTPILTRYLKLVPTMWNKVINMRIEPLGCYEPYLEVSEEFKEVDKPKSKCNVCDGIIVAPSMDSAEECKCTDSLYWNGSSCIQQNLCPCVENYVSYPIGSKFENNKCEECVCVLGGHSNCKPKKCPPCEENLRSVITPGCFCKCEPCPKHQRLCPSSGDCIPELLWCNGVQDCADDEDASCKHEFVVTPEKQKVENETVVITCPEPKCPPNMQIKLTEKKQRKMSKMFSSSYHKQFTMVTDGNKVTKTKVITSTKEFLPMPSQELGFVREDECREFTCVPQPSKVVNKNETITCAEPKCPDNYDIELDLSSAKPGDCAKYTCVLRPTKDDYCELSGKSFTTFDGTEYKYDTCSHILARDLVNSSWLISVHLQCNDETRKVCRKMITIKDLSAPATLTLMPNMKLNFNGFEYTVQQLINSPICKAAFVISQPGNTVLVVSPQHGFWVLYDKIGYIKIGVSSKYIGTVDGLCGFYNGIPTDDKRSPDGALQTNTMKFGDSWFDKQVPKEECYPQVCPLDLQKKSLALCNSIKHPTFFKCGRAVNYKQFVSKCIETTCECLRANNGNEKSCKCNILQDFVKKCLTVNPDVQLNTWRTLLQCEISCPKPLVHSDCYKRRCEPSCDTLNSDDCPIIPDACFAGCYCPEGTVRKGDNCVPIAECRDCICNSFGTSKYFTYDRNSFTFNGNCTYLLSRDIVLPGVHTFQVYVTMDSCQKLGQPSSSEHTSCAKALHILNGDHLIHIQRVPKQQNALQVFVDGFEVKELPYKDSWIGLRQVVGKELILSLPDSHVELTAAFKDLVFSLGVPSLKYGSKMEGLCGDCNSDPNNDLKINPATKKKGQKPSNALVDVIKSWQSNEPKLGLTANECSSEEVAKQDCIPLPPERDPCLLFFNPELFGKCAMIVDPMLYVSACQQDMCKPGNDQKGACESLAAYAKACVKQGICVNWRRPDICPYDCPAEMTYQACGCAKSCDTIKAMSEFDAINIKTTAVIKTVTTEDMCPSEEKFEGCFCPKGQVLDHGKCIAEAECNKCDDGVHLPGEKWTKDKCTECECDSTGKTTCVLEKCLVEENICAEGFKPQKIVANDKCCARFACVPEPKLPPAALCLEPLMPICGPDQFKKQKTGADGCPQYICECKPKEECDPLPTDVSLAPGEVLERSEAGCCPTQRIVCNKESCPAKPTKCEQQFYEMKTIEDSSVCCPTYLCVPPKDLCIIENAKQKYTQKVGDKWVDPEDPCLNYLCAYGPNDTTQIIKNSEQCDKTCPLGFTYEASQDKQKCCGECVQTECIFETKLYKPDERWMSADNCTTYSCLARDKVLFVSSAVQSCPDVSKCAAHLLYKDGCCTYCKEEPKFEDMKNCLPVSLAEHETKELIKFNKKGHGDCVNKEPIQQFTECVGACNSGSKYNRATLGQDKVCSCCNIISYKTISVKLTCEDGTVIDKELEIPSSCGCQPCSDSMHYKFADLIDIRMQPLPLPELLNRGRN